MCCWWIQTELVIFVTPRVLPNTLLPGTTAFSGTAICDNTTNVGTQMAAPQMSSAPALSQGRKSSQVTVIHGTDKSDLNVPTSP